MYTSVEPIFSAKTNDGSSTFDSPAVLARFVSAFSLQAFFTDGAATGTMKMQFSNDENTPTHWSDVPSATVTVTAGGTVSIAFTWSSYQWIRAEFVATGGAGTFTANLKTIGG